MPQRKSTSIALHLSESFAELIVQQQNKSTQKRWYWPALKPSAVLREALAQLQLESIHEPIKVALAVRFFEKVFDRRLSGNVAQVVTSGFENWAYLRQPLEGPAFSPTSQRRSPLANPELIFPLSERISAEGEILQPILESELEFIAAKLKLMKVEKLAINLLHGGRYSKHEDFAADYFRSQGFQVFLSPHKGGREDEVQRWRRNLMNAGMSGTLEEVLTDIKLAFVEKNLPVQFQISTTQGLVSELEADQYIDTLMGPWCLLLEKHKAPQSILYLGLEKFVWMDHEQKSDWQSPWGSVNMFTPLTRYLRIQPTLRLDSGWLSEVEISQHEESFEPGPMCLGRSVKPTVFDIWAAHLAMNELPGLESLVQNTGISRFKDMVKVWLRSAKKSGSKDETAQIKELHNLVMHQLAIEIDLLPGEEYIVLLGPLAEILGPELQKLLKVKQLRLQTEQAGFAIPQTLMEKL